ncbi:MULTISPECIES: cytochrome c biogenesis CcdA family protein [Virgibacillus]|jgi:cytochrome c-type biogenesis protein|uniref:Cytochrome C biogenesis protein CcdA n=1 Tax=Virgibacillus halodenitrificans TaxID=1482 RepID=A0AAC9J6V1_VIRHA|nr:MULTISPECIES: cytochrome c biogenesis protein CcdA [Virgibacillus]AIF44884.1 cytochrome C biogenesis protein [Virgibacillus sp. SK37]APC49979.1 cytochrome C biogenesis protein CcdA [Virgibacillus halodenitrificans]MBD1222499.1 sulfite exporter TauE/SafE family protein [Virgibacillus halodenitrificans]MCG1027726.1 sulfite exporter TauE/SafE family protein [Virgibacillus halodenitrificans]MCJ0932136.1 cytochrome c biogenesis protein CcdA [Virgibacillus halodenitrificans]
MTSAADLTIWLAFGAGLLSFLSPCTLPIFPAYLSYITGMSVKEMQDKPSMKIRSKLLIHSVFFLLGVSLIFIGLGIGVSFLGQWIQGLLAGQSGLFIQRIAGIFIIIMGLFVAGWINITSFMKEKRFRFTNKPVGYLGTVFVGMGFAAGWTPCIGPIFASILVVAASNPGQGGLYTLMYVIGFAVPFLVLTFFLGSTRWIVRYSDKIMKVGGIVMILMGVLLFTGQMPRISAFLLKLVQDTWLTKLG